MLRTFLLTFLLFVSCGYKAVNFDKHLNVCIEKVYINSQEPTVLDVLNREIRDAVLASSNKLDCSYKKNIVLYLALKSISFYPIGYSQAQRANVYKISMDVNLKIEDKEGNMILSKDIVETTQYVGSGLRADIEKRYAIEELGKLIQIRIFSILNSLK